VRVVTPGENPAGEVVTRPGFSLSEGMVLHVATPEPTLPAQPDGTPIEALEVVYEDEALVVIDKQAGLLSHPASGFEATTVAGLAEQRFGPLPCLSGEDRPGIVHRLDRLTSGVMALARTEQAGQELQRQFAAREVKKTYLALVHGVPRFESDWIEARTAPDPRHPARQRALPVDAEDGREARTLYQVVERFHGHTCVECRPETGRTHQIRIHMQHAGFPIVGDRLYRPGGALKVPLPAEAPVPGRQALHAAKLELAHPLSGEWMSFEAAPPRDFVTLRAWLRREMPCEPQ